MARIGRKRNGGFGVADGNKQTLAHWNCQRQFDPEFAAFAFLRAIFFCRLMTSAPFPQVGVRSLIDTVFSHDDGRRSRMIGAPKATHGRRFRRLVAALSIVAA